MKRPIDLPRVKASLARLDRLAEQHPEAFRPDRLERLEHDMQDMEHEGHEGQQGQQGQQIAVRMTGAMIAALDGFTSRWREENPGASLTRSDAVRMLLTKALDLR